ncbi:MAG TPA: DUF3857 domain-containing protein [Candidatus Angelobacter sp.]|nr:DUF3857 domain-containing protein [Candidatus Angelobacter sp.]
MLVFAMLSCLSTLASAGVPDWMRSLAQQPAKKYADDANAVVLLHDVETTVRDKGEIVTHERVAYRILRPEGKSYAHFGVPFDQETRVNYLRGWSITPKGQEYEARDKDTFEVSASTYEVFSDEKVKFIQIPGADVGTVVGYEFEHKRRPYLFQDWWYFQRTIPVEKSRYTLHLPSSWEYRADWINHSEQKPAEEGNNTSSWEIADIPRIESEYRKLPDDALAGRMIVTFYSEKVRSQTYRSWNELAVWHAQLISGVFGSSPAMQQKILELAPPSMPILGRIKALASFAQRDIRYAAIEVGIGGLRPHPADEVFAHRYGDCKDKATLLSTMLREIGVKSFYMPIHDERGIYTEKTPPNLGFNHVILAIQMPQGSVPKPLPAMINHPKLGQLLIFDPTQELVPFGELPYYEQDSFALLVTGNDGGELIHLPASAPELNTYRRNTKVKLLADGTLEGEIDETMSGYLAMLGRAYLKHESQNERKKIIEHFMGTNLGNFQVQNVEMENANEIDKDLILHFKITVGHYAKNAGPLLLVRPRVVGEMAGPIDASKPRHYPYEFDAPFLRSDSVEISLPEGYGVDELPNSAKGDFSFAEYKSKTEQAGNVLKYSREYKMETTSVPAEKFDDLRHLFSQIIADEKSMAVLKKMN